MLVISAEDELWVVEEVVLDVSVDVFELDELGGVELEELGSVACGVLLL